jgi:hypothetical protein
MMNVVFLIKRLALIQNTMIAFCPPDAEVVGMTINNDDSKPEIMLGMGGNIAIAGTLRDLIATALTEQKIEFTMDEQRSRRRSDVDGEFRFTTPGFVISLVNFNEYNAALALTDEGKNDPTASQVTVTDEELESA